MAAARGQMTEVLNEQRPISWLSVIWAARYRTPARFVALIALLPPWTTTGLIFALIPWRIAVRNYIDQSQQFALCAIALVYPIVSLLRQGRFRIAALFVALAIGFLANMMFVVVSRTALVTLPILIVVFALLHLRRRTALFAVGAMGLLAVLLWTASPRLRATVAKFNGDYEVR